MDDDRRSGVAREIEVRSLMGDSVRVSVEPSDTVQDLKRRLRQCFPPAASAPDFHLFLKVIGLIVSAFNIAVSESFV